MARGSRSSRRSDAVMMGLVRDDRSVVDLVTRAGEDDKDAWDEIVDRYAPLVWSICQRYGLSRADADDVGASVWLRLVERLDTIREPAALPGWLATTTRHECLRAIRAKDRELPVDDNERLAGDTDPAADDWLLKQERLIALRTAFADLPERCRRLLTLLFSESAAPYDEISDTLDMPVGTIGPTRQRCLAKLRRNPALAPLVNVSAEL